eukprot:6196022-Pleurochrysis_carterae.AAC.2
MPETVREQTATGELVFYRLRPQSNFELSASEQSVVARMPLWETRDWHYWMFWTQPWMNIAAKPIAPQRLDPTGRAVSI